MQPALTGRLYTPPSSAAALACPFNQFEVTRMLLDQGAAIAGIHEELALLREFLMGRHSQPLPPPQAPLPTTTQAALPAGMTQAALPAPSAPSWTTFDTAFVSDGVPIHRVPFPHSPSPLPPWLSGTLLEPVFSSPPPRTVPPPLLGSATASHGGPRVPRVLYGGVDGTLFPSDVGATTGATTASFGLPLRSEGASQAVPRFFKFEFPTYDSLDDPLNWLNHCEQFFSG
jgi:hypothetical protein